MKIGLYSPYFDSLGGGERYVLTIAEHWSKHHDIDIFWDSPVIIQEGNRRFNLDLSRVRIVPDIFRSRRFIRKLLITRLYDCIVFLSDGSVPTSFAKHNILHIQVPFAHVSIPFWKSKQYQAIVCNSKFTKQNLDDTVQIPVSVIYPPVDSFGSKRGKKTKTILSVGRFSGFYGAKKYDILIETYRRIHKYSQLDGWKYIIAGGLLKSDIAYFNQLKLKAKGLPIEFYPNCPLSTLRTLYAHASLYWHAAGFGEHNPQNMEHFGISTVEAMSAGCIPLVFAGGGQKEVIIDNQNGFLWESPDELIRKTIHCIKTEYSLESMRVSARKRVQNFSKVRFQKSFDSLLSKICKDD